MILEKHLTSEYLKTSDYNLFSFHKKEYPNAFVFFAKKRKPDNKLSGFLFYKDEDIIRSAFSKVYLLNLLNLAVQQMK